MASHILINQMPSGKAALQGNSAVAVPLHQPLEEAIAQLQYLLSPMKRLSQSQQLYRLTKQADKLVYGGVKAWRRIQGEGNGLLV